MALFTWVTNFAVRSLPCVEFQREVPGAKWKQRRRAGKPDFRPATVCWRQGRGTRAWLGLCAPSGDHGLLRDGLRWHGHGEGHSVQREATATSPESGIKAPLQLHQCVAMPRSYERSKKVAGRELGRAWAAGGACRRWARRAGEEGYGSSELCAADEGDREVKRMTTKLPSSCVGAHAGRQHELGSATERRWPPTLVGAL